MLATISQSFDIYIDIMRQELDWGDIHNTAK